MLIGDIDYIRNKEENERKELANIQEKQAEISPISSEKAKDLLSDSLEKSNNKVIADLIEACSQNQIQTQVDIFNMNQVKANILRVIKLNGLLGKIEDEAIQRFSKRPDLISNKELLEFLNVIAQQIDRSQKYADGSRDIAPIKLAQKNEVNINVLPGDKEGKEKIIDAVSTILSQIRREQNKVDKQEAQQPDQSSDISDVAGIVDNNTDTENTTLGQNPIDFQ